MMIHRLNVRCAACDYEGLAEYELCPKQIEYDIDKHIDSLTNSLSSQIKKITDELRKHMLITRRLKSVGAIHMGQCHTHACKCIPCRTFLEEV